MTLNGIVLVTILITTRISTVKSNDNKPEEQDTNILGSLAFNDQTLASSNPGSNPAYIQPSATSVPGGIPSNIILSAARNPGETKTYIQPSATSIPSIPAYIQPSATGIHGNTVINVQPLATRNSGGSPANIQPSATSLPGGIPSNINLSAASNPEKTNTIIQPSATSLPSTPANIQPSATSIPGNTDINVQPLASSNPGGSLANIPTSATSFPVGISSNIHLSAACNPGKTITNIQPSTTSISSTPAYIQPSATSIPGNTDINAQPLATSNPGGSLANIPPSATSFPVGISSNIHLSAESNTRETQTTIQPLATSIPGSTPATYNVQPLATSIPGYSPVSVQPLATSIPGYTPINVQPLATRIPGYTPVNVQPLATSIPGGTHANVPPFATSNPGSPNVNVQPLATSIPGDTSANVQPSATRIPVTDESSVTTNPENTFTTLFLDSYVPLLVGKVLDISSAVHINVPFPKDLGKKGSSTYDHYSKIFHSALDKKYEHLDGFVGIIILGFRNGSIITDYTMKFNADFVHRNTKKLKVALTDLNKNWTAFEKDLEMQNISGNVVLPATENELSQNDWNKITDVCSVQDVCSPGYMCKNGTCEAICSRSYDCSNHGICVIDSHGKSPKCMCNVPYTGDNCEKKNTQQTNIFTSRERQLIIEIASGAGGGVTLFLLVILVCVCVQWRRSEAKVRKFDEKSLKENETFDLKELGGKTNPIYDKDIESNVADTIPSRRGSLERRSHDRRGSLERRSPDRRESLERRPPPYAPSDGSRGYKMESFGNPLDYDRNSERNFIRRDDGRVYHVIDDGEPSNQTLLYQPSRYQQSNGSIAQDHGQPRYTDYPRTHSVYDRIDTTREYKISRPNIGGRSRNYDY